MTGIWIGINAAIAFWLIGNVLYLHQTGRWPRLVPARVLVMPSVLATAGGLTSFLGIRLSDSVPGVHEVGNVLEAAGVSIMGGAIVGFVVAVIQRHFDDDRSDREAARDADFTLSLTMATSQNLRGIDLKLRDLHGRYLVGKDLSGAQLGGADLSRANLGGAVLQRADLTGALLVGADMSGADLRHADLTGADLTGANLSGAQLDDVQYDETTVWWDRTRGQMPLRSP